MAREYTKEPALEQRFRQVRDELHTHLTWCRIRVCGVHGGMESKGKTVLANIKKASAVDLCLIDAELIVRVNMDAWKRLTEAQQRALIDHELCHATTELDKQGEVNLKMVGHDVEEFSAIVERHGLWKGDLRDFLEQADQLKLFESQVE